MPTELRTKIITHGRVSLLSRSKAWVEKHSSLTKRDSLQQEGIGSGEEGRYNDEQARDSVDGDAVRGDAPEKPLGVSTRAAKARLIAGQQKALENKHSYPKTPRVPARIEPAAGGGADISAVAGCEGHTARASIAGAHRLEDLGSTVLQEGAV